MKHRKAYKKVFKNKRKKCTNIAEDDHECKKEKGINRNVADDKLKHEDCKNILFSGLYVRYGMDRFESEDHNIGANRINEVSL